MYVKNVMDKIQTHESRIHIDICNVVMVGVYHAVGVGFAIDRRSDLACLA